MKMLNRSETAFPGEDSPFQLRALPRVAVSLPAEIEFGDRAGRIGCRLRDLGTGGACLLTPSPFALSTMRHVVIHLPDGPLRLGLEGRWQRESSLESSMLTGVKFVGVDPERSHRLQRFVEGRASELVHFLLTSSDLSDLSLDEAMDTALATRLREAPAGTYICREGDGRSVRAPGEESLFIVLNGSVSLGASLVREHAIEVGRVLPGGLFNGIPLVADTESPFSAVVERDASLLELDRSAFRFLESAKPFVAHRLSRAIVARHVEQVRALLARFASSARKP